MKGKTSSNNQLGVCATPTGTPAFSLSLSQFDFQLYHFFLGPFVLSLSTISSALANFHSFDNGDAIEEENISMLVASWI